MRRGTGVCCIHQIGTTLTEKMLRKRKEKRKKDFFLKEMNRKREKARAKRVDRKLKKKARGVCVCGINRVGKSLVKKNKIKTERKREEKCTESNEGMTVIKQKTLHNHSNNSSEEQKQRKKNT